MIIMCYWGMQHEEEGRNWGFHLDGMLYYIIGVPHVCLLDTPRDSYMFINLQSLSERPSTLR